MTYEEENRQLLHELLGDTFFRDFSDRDKKEKMFGNLELQLTSACNLKCSYCYYSSVSGKGKELNKHVSWETLSKNTDILFDWLKKNNYVPSAIDIFSGDSLVFPQSHEIIRKAVQFYIDMDCKGSVAIPSNMTFIKNKDLVASIEEIMEYAKAHGVGIHISASIDGKFADPISRQPVAKQNIREYYSDEFYDDVFAFCKKYNYGFHPMISSDNIHVWEDNFAWFQGMLKKHDIPWNNMYLLEVRNDGWTGTQIKQYGKFLRSVLEFTYDTVNNYHAYLTRFITSSKKEQKINNMNLFNNVSVIGRGIGCSLQTTLFVKMGDLTCNSCHRLSYDALNGFKFVVQDDEIIDIEPLNLSFYIGTLTLETKALPYCENCLIKHLCSSGCLGAQLEATGDAFTPIPSVCLLQHQKLKTQIDFLKGRGLFKAVVDRVSHDLAQTMIEFDNIRKGEDK